MLIGLNFMVWAEIINISFPKPRPAQAEAGGSDWLPSGMALTWLCTDPGSQ